jgi:hypothetical protein
MGRSGRKIIASKDEMLETLYLRFTIEIDPNMLMAKLALNQDYVQW